jgi:hypothetical protein
MTQFAIERSFGRQAFGADPGGYHAARPAYPESVFEILWERCGLAHRTATFEIGAATGTATCSRRRRSNVAQADQERDAGLETVGIWRMLVKRGAQT